MMNNVYLMVWGIIEIFSGLTVFFTLGFVKPRWVLQYALFYATWLDKGNKKRQKVEKTAKNSLLTKID